ncbi:MAG: sigma 54-interacting transcriptional regulator [Planctomycetes bacterium]|nr:sigma 54-interacting transcriptional regulator [Planctomycetota bacterium]
MPHPLKSQPVPELGPRYRLIRELGRGGSGTVYRVEDSHLKKELALKLLRSPVPSEEAEAIRREFALLAGIEHPLIVLNNLGLAYGQCDRYDEALSALRAAERACRRLEEGPSLASIHGNLAIVHAKLGDFAGAERTLDESEAIGAAGSGRRQDLLLTHARGLVRILRGRYAEAEPPLRASMALAVANGDRHVAAFEAANLGEALLVQGRYAEAERDLERLSGSDSPPRVRKLALARLALLHGLTARPRKVEEAVERRDAIPAEAPVPYLDAWDSLFLGWAYSASGAAARAAPLLREAEAFFRERGLKPGLSLALWVQAEGRFLRGDREGARDLLSSSSSPGPGSDLLEVLWPLLSARLLLSGAATPERRKRCADLLAEAGRALVGNRLPEWECRLAALRAILGADGERGAATVRAARQEIAKEVPEPSRRRYLASEHWRAWTAGLEACGAERAAGIEPTAGRAATTKTVFMGRTPAPGARSRLIAHSAPMRRLAADLDRLRGSDLPVLIAGETGTGKELVARAIHEESRRGSGPFRTIDLSSIPEGLLESELFGARAGAFTDLREDRPGLLALAGGGTILFDGIGAAPPEAQGKLLRTLSARAYRPLGSSAEEPLDVRFLFATARDLEAEVREGRFRNDLLHRIRVVTLRVPPLRERSEDLEELVPLLAAARGAEPPRVEAGALELLRRHPWPGNVRELENVLSRLRVDDPERITRKAVAQVLSGPEPGAFFPRHILQADGLEALKERLERDYILHHYSRLLGDSGALCRFLGLSPRQLYRRANRLGISFREAKRRLGGR